MPNILEQAVIDAELIREAALKNAEQIVLERYAPKIKETMMTLLEQDDEEFDMGDLNNEDPGGEGADEAGDNEGAPYEPKGEEGELVDDLSLAATGDEKDNDEEIDLGTIKESDEEDDDEEVDLGEILNEEDVEDVDEEDGFPGGGNNRPGSTTESEESTSEYDVGTVGEDKEPAGQGIHVNVGGKAPQDGNSSPDLTFEQDRDARIMLNNEDEEDNNSDDFGKGFAEKGATLRENLEKTEKNLSIVRKKNKVLREQNSRLKEYIIKITDLLEVSSNEQAKLLCIKEVLENSSLNERQKRDISSEIEQTETAEKAVVLKESLVRMATHAKIKKNRLESVHDVGAQYGHGILPNKPVVMKENKSFDQPKKPTQKTRWMRMAGLDRE